MGKQLALQQKQDKRRRRSIGNMSDNKYNIRADIQMWIAHQNRVNATDHTEYGPEALYILKTVRTHHATSKEQHHRDSKNGAKNAII